MKKKYYIIKAGNNKYGIPQFIFSYLDCDDYVISHVPTIMDRKRATDLYKRILKDYNGKELKGPFGRKDIKINLELIEYNS